MSGYPGVGDAPRSAGIAVERGSAPSDGDGLVLDVHGNVYVAVLTRSAVVRINARHRSEKDDSGILLPNSVSPLYAPLDFPASLVFGTGGG